MPDERAQGMAGPELSHEERVEHYAKLGNRVRLDLWKAVWEASQVMGYDEIREHVEGTITQIVSDEP